MRSAARKAALATNVALSAMNAQPGPTVATSTPATAGATTFAVDRDSCSNPFARWRRSARDRLRHEPGRGRVEERLRGAVDRHQDQQVPDLRPTGDEKHPDRRLRAGTNAVGRQHHDVPRQPVGPDAADEQEDDHRDHPRREHQPERRRGALELQDGEGERDRHQLVPEVGDRSTGEQEFEAGFP